MVTFPGSCICTQPCHIHTYTWNNLSNPLCYTTFTWEKQTYWGLNPWGSGILYGLLLHAKKLLDNSSYLKTGKKLYLPSATERRKLRCMIPFYPPMHVHINIWIQSSPLHRHASNCSSWLILDISHKTTSERWDGVEMNAPVDALINTSPLTNFIVTPPVVRN